MVLILKRNFRPVNSVVLALLMPAFGAQAELELLPSVEVQTLYYNIESEQFDNIDADIFAVEPRFALNYSSRKLEVGMAADHKILRRDLGQGNVSTDSFTNYNLRSQFTPIDNVLTLNATAAQNNVNFAANQALVNDIYLGSEDLAKTKNWFIGANFIVPNPTIVGSNASFSESKVESDQAINAVGRLENRNTAYNLQLFQGNEFRSFRWNVAGAVQETRNGNAVSNRNAFDFNTKLYTANASFGIISELGLVITGQIEENDLGQQQVFLGQQGDFKSYGAGLEWFSSPGRNISITYNRSSRRNDGFENVDNEDQENEDNFLAATINWALSARTNFQASHSRRFFGDTSNGNLSYNTKNLRIQIGYSEDVTSFARQVVTQSDLGVFLCPLGDAQLGDCIQPETLEFDDLIGNQLVNFFEPNIDITDEVFIRKAWQGNIGWDRRKLTFNLGFNIGSTDFLSTERRQIIKSATFSVAYRVGVHTDVNFSTAYNSVDGDLGNLPPIGGGLGGFGGVGIVGDTRSATAGLSHRLSNKLTMNLDFRYLDRDTVEASFFELTDRRWTLSLGYEL